MAAPPPDTKKMRRKKLGDHQYFKEEEHKRFSVLAAMRNVARMGLLRCVASRSIDYVELLAWLVHNLVALFEINQDAPVLGHALVRLNALKEDVAM